MTIFQRLMSIPLPFTRLSVTASLQVEKEYGEAIAILAGDALLTMAFDMLADRKLNSRLDSASLLSIIKILASASGSAGMVGGQAADIQASGNEVNLPEVEYIHIHKTGALIRASVCIGAIAGNASKDELHALTRYGECI